MAVGGSVGETKPTEGTVNQSRTGPAMSSSSKDDEKAGESLPPRHTTPTGPEGTAETEGATTTTSPCGTGGSQSSLGIPPRRQESGTMLPPPPPPLPSYAESLGSPYMPTAYLQRAPSSSRSLSLGSGLGALHLSQSLPHSPAGGPQPNVLGLRHLRSASASPMSLGASAVRTPSVPFIPNLATAGSPRVSSANSAAAAAVAAALLTSPPATPVAVPGPAHLTPSALAAVDSAMEAERARAKEEEREEALMDAAGLRAALKRERAHSARLAADLAGHRAAAVASQAEAEVHEEGRINGLMRRLECLHREKGRIILELEREEEMLTNTLQKKLNEVRREKALLEKQIEREQSSRSNLQSKLSNMTGAAASATVQAMAKDNESSVATEIQAETKSGGDE